MDTSVVTDLGIRVNNLGLMSDRTNLLIGAGISFISGILLIGFSQKPELSASEATRKCPYCAEQVKAQAIICRFCQKDLPMLTPTNKRVLPNQPKEPPARLKVIYQTIILGLFAYTLLALCTDLIRGVIYIFQK